MISSQLVMINAQDVASADIRRQTHATDYMKECAEFQLELGGNHVLVCWGAGIYETGTPRGQMWVNSVNSVRKFAEWALNRHLLVSIEMDPHVYYIVNSLELMARLIEEVGMPNVFANIDVGHLCITREGPDALERVSRRILHVHLSETNSFEHTNGIIGSGVVDFQSYISKLQEIGIEDNCSRNNTPCVAAIEMGQQDHVDDPDRWMRESLAYLEEALPEVKILE